MLGMFPAMMIMNGSFPHGIGANKEACESNERIVELLPHLRRKIEGKQSLWKCKHMSARSQVA